MGKKIYQPIVIESTEQIIDILTETFFFEDYDLSSKEFARQYLLDKLTIKFIEGKLDLEDGEIFTEDEFNTSLREIVAGTMLYDLKEKGLVESYEDDNTEEMFFLTDKVKKLLMYTE